MIVECPCGWSGYDDELYQDKCPKCESPVMAAASEDQPRRTGNRIMDDMIRGMDMIMEVNK